MAKVLEVTMLSEVDLDLTGSPQSDVWITYDVAFSANYLTYLGTSGAEMMEVWEGAFTNVGEFAGTVVPSGIKWYSSDDSTETYASFGPTTAMQFYRFEEHITAGTPRTRAVYIDGVSIGTLTSAENLDDISWIYLKPGGAPGAGRIAYYDNFKVGTTRGGSEVTSDDFEGSLNPLWQNFGATIIDDPGIAPAAGGSPPPPPPDSHALVVKLYDLASNELADISLIALEKTMTRRLNQARSFKVTAPAGHHLLTDVAGDGYSNLRKGNRKLLVWEDGTIIFHGRVFTVERNGDGNENLATITAFDPFMELGYDSDDRAGRPVRDATGNFVDPTFVGTGSGGASVLSGPDLIRQVIDNSVSNSGAAGDMEGALPIDTTTGTFDIDVPPAVDLSVIDTMDWPVLIGDFVNQLVESNVVDVDMRPVDPSEGFDPYVMVVLSAVSSQGTDRSGTVHFDYWTGSKNAMACRHVEDFATICNKLYDYLGPRRDVEHWRANITPGSPGTTVDPSASRTLYGGEFMSIRVFDSVGDESSSRPLYIALWNAEQGLRVEPRDLLFITPNPGAKALFEPPASFDVGDQVAINVGSAFGVTLAETQRVYGYDKTWDRQGIARISELLTSADVT